MKKVTIEAGEAARNKGGVQAVKLLSKPEVDVVHIRIVPGATLPLHVTPVDVFFYILQGSGEVEIGPERERVSPDMLIESPKDIPHALHNPGEEDFRVLVVKTPRP